jgi:hypothetical protein
LNAEAGRAGGGRNPSLRLDGGEQPRSAVIQMTRSIRHIMKTSAEQKAAMSRPSLKLLAALAPVAAGALMLAAPAMAPAQTPAQTPAQSEVLPGYWEYTTSALGQNETHQKCVRPSEINRFFGGLSTNRWRCTYPTRVVGNGRARFEGTCQDKKGRRIQVRLNGTYEDTSFSFRGGAQLLRGTPYIPASITARRISAQCPANAEYF